MNDTAKCAGVGCSIRDCCDRFVRPAVDGQRWVEPAWWPARTSQSRRSRRRCLNMVPILPDPIEPHGGAREEGDQC
jgi:hypothetical protein